MRMTGRDTRSLFAPPPPGLLVTRSFLIPSFSMPYFTKYDLSGVYSHNSRVNAWASATKTISLSRWGQIHVPSPYD